VIVVFLTARSLWYAFLTVSLLYGCGNLVLLVPVRYLQSLPDQIKPHSVIETRLDHMEHNRNFSMNGDYQKV
jgi:hypothetical protein